MKKWTLGTKVLLICLSLGMLDALQGSLSLVNLYRSRSTVNALDSDTFATLYWAGKLKGVAKDQRIAVIFYLNATSNEDRAKYEAQVANAEEELKSIRNNYPKSDPRDRGAIAACEREQAKFYHAWEEIRELMQAGKKDEAWNVYNTKLMQATLRRRKFEDYLAELDQERGQSLSQDSIRAVSMGIPVVWAILFLTVILGTTSFLLFANSVRRAKRRFEEQAEQLSATNASLVLAMEERERAQADLLKSTEMFRQLTENIQELFWVMDGAGSRMQYLSPGFEHIWGLPRDEVYSDLDRLREAIHPDDRQAAQENLRKQLRGENTEFEFRIPQKGGEAWIREKSFPICDPDGRVVRVVGVTEDITARKRADEAQALLASIVESSEDAILAYAPDGAILTWNLGGEKIFGYSAEEAIGKPVTMLVAPERQNSIAQVTQRVLQGHSLLQRPGLGVRKDGSRIHVSVTSWPMRNSLGEIKAISVVLRDVTKPHKAEEAHALLASIVESSDDAIFGANLDGTVFSWNQAAETLLGYQEREIIGRNAAVLGVSSHGDRISQMLKTLCKGWAIGTYETILRHKNGGEVDVALSVSPIQNSAGEVVGASAIARDISQRLRAERQLQESEERFRSVFECAPFGVCDIALDARYILVNSTFCAMVGYSRQELLSKTWMDVTIPEDIHISQRMLDQVILSPGGTAESEKRYRHRDGHTIWARLSLSLVHDAYGRPLHVVAHAEDITERKQTKILREFQHSLIRTIHDVSLDGILVVNENGNVVSHNRRFLDIWHIPPSKIPDPAIDITAGTPDEAILSAVMDCIDDAEAFLKRVLELYADQNANDQCEIQLKDGRTLERYTTSLRNEEGKYLARVWFFRDITEHKQAEADLVQAREDAEAANRRLSAQHLILDGERKILRSFIDNVPHSMYVKDTESRFMVANSFAARWGGWEKPEDVLGKTDFDFFPQELAAKFYEDEQRVIRTGQPIFDKEERFDGDAASETRWILSTKVPLFNSAGQVTGIAGIGREITKHKKIEEAIRETNRQLEEETARANRLAAEAQKANSAKSEFLANMSHEIRTPMNGIIGMTGLLLDTELTPEQRHYSEIVRSSGESLLTVINEILDFSKIEAKKLELEAVEFDLPHLLDSLAATLAAQAQAKGIELVVSADSALPTRLLGDPGRLRQILTNLAGNAIKFTRKGEVVVRAQLLEAGGGDCLLRFSVRDTGIGIPEDKLGLLFQKFSQLETSTTRRFGGTGLGLAISKQLAELMDGSIGVSSQLGTGSEFWFTVRLGKANQPARTLAEEQALASVRGARILLVDDNAASRALLSALTASWAMRPTEAEGGLSALQALYRAQAESDPFRAAVIDLQMPGMDGAALGRAIRSVKLLANTRMVVLTPLGGRHGARLYEKLGFTSCIPKPVRAQELFDSLFSVLSGAALTASASGPGLNRAARKEELPFANINARILLAEDNPTNQKVALAMLKKLGLHADAVANGIEALQSLEFIPYDLVLMDVRMPGMDGLEATRRIRDPHSAVRNHALPIIAMTANAMASDREDCLQAGMSGFVPKPVSLEALREELERWLRPGGDTDSGKAQLSAPLPAGEEQAPVFNRAGVLQRMMGDEELAMAVITAFLDDMPHQIEDLKDLLRAGDATGSGRLAHSIKGAAANVGGERLRHAALEMEKAADAGNLDVAQAGMANLEAQFLLLAGVASS